MTRSNIGRKLRPLALGLTLGLSIPLLSPTVRAWAQDYGISRRELRDFDEFLNTHPGAAEDLRNNPGLVNNQRWMERHSELHTFLRSHPGVREELREHPARFMYWEGRYGHGHYAYEGRGWEFRTETRRFDEFLDSHPGVAERLRRDPNLINNREFVQDHPELREFLRNHSAIRQDLQSHPHVFVQRASR